MTVPKIVRRTMEASELPAAVHWHEGMLLAPQHFQRAALRSEALQAYHTTAASPFHWGLMDLQSDFADGILTVRSVEAVMPDGLVVAASGADLAIDLKKAEKDIRDGKRTTVYLAVAAHQAGERFEQRYDFKAKEKVADDTTGKDDLEIEILEPKLQLVLADELTSSHAGFPLARVAWKNGMLVVEDDEKRFEPPWLRVKPKSRIYGICASVAMRLRDAATTLSRRAEAGSKSDEGTQLLTMRLVIHSFVSSLLPFEVALESGVAHPFELYRSLASILGNVWTAGDPPHLPAYDHDNLLPCFAGAAKEIDVILNKAASKRYSEHPFVFNRDEFSLPIDKEWLGREMLLGVRVPHGHAQKEVDEWVSGSVMGARTPSASLRQRRMKGLERERLRVHELIPTPDVVFYQITADEHLLRPGEDLVIGNQGEGDEGKPAEIVLYVKTKD